MPLVFMLLYCTVSIVIVATNALRRFLSYRYRSTGQPQHHLSWPIFQVFFLHHGACSTQLLERRRPGGQGFAEALSQNYAVLLGCK
jgi:hypothetical protein